MIYDAPAPCYLTRGIIGCDGQRACVRAKSAFTFDSVSHCILCKYPLRTRYWQSPLYLVLYHSLTPKPLLQCYKSKLTQPARLIYCVCLQRFESSNGTLLHSFRRSWQKGPQALHRAQETLYYTQNLPDVGKIKFNVNRQVTFLINL